MFSNHKITNRALALFVFITSLLLYLSTMAPTASFWDSGEFIAVAHGLQVNHPPGAPFYTLLGRIFSMFMPLNYVAESINFISVLSSALTVMLLYLVIIRLAEEFSERWEALSNTDKIGVYSGAVIGALTFAVTDTFWFNAVEAEVYALSMFFTAMVVWLALKWAENPDEPYNERWLILIAYLFGIAIGIHLLNLLALFFVALIIYFKKREFGFKSLAITAGITVVAFLIIYPFTIFILPGILESVNASTYGLIGPVTFMILIVGILVGAIYYTQKNEYRLANIVLICYAMILIGFSSYALIFIRSIADPPIDENDPETVESFISYLKREQYGSTPLLKGFSFDNETGRIDRNEKVWFPRRYSGRSIHTQQYKNYSSDLDYFIDYQLGHMYFRYFNWNFIGRDSDIQGAPWQAGFVETQHEDNPAHNSYYYLPFLLGLFGMLFHFQRDWKRALSVLTLFIMTGAAIIVFLNQTPMEPRERDYAYVGSFFAFSIWIGMGATGIIALIKEHLTTNKIAAYATTGILFLAIPLLMGVQNYNDSDRSYNYIAGDYAYNLLMSAAPNAILFTNGDNDTFPLWYLQEVKGVRTDVRVVCLSLLNTEWYIKQMRDQWSHESPPLPITFTNEEIEEMTSGLTIQQPDTINIPVNKALLSRAFLNAENYRNALNISSHPEASIYEPEVDFGMPVDSLENKLAWFYKGRPAGPGPGGETRYYSRVQDKVVINILKNNEWLRPVYFATTVSRQSQLGLQHYLRFEGQALRIVPQYHQDISIFGWIDPEIHSNTYENFRFRHWSDPKTYLNSNIRRMLSNYRYGITALAESYMEMNKPDSAAKWLSWGEDHLPFKPFVDDDTRSVVLYAYSYAEAEETDDAIRLAERATDEALQNLQNTLAEFDELRTTIVELEREIEQARMNADLDLQRELTQQIQNLSQENQNITRNISSAVSNLIILQRIYFITENQANAQSLAQQVNMITGGRVAFPETEAENMEKFSRFGF